MSVICNVNARRGFLRDDEPDLLREDDLLMFGIGRSSCLDLTLTKAWDTCKLAFSGKSE